MAPHRWKAKWWCLTNCIDWVNLAFNWFNLMTSGYWSSRDSENMKMRLIRITRLHRCCRCGMVNGNMAPCYQIKADHLNWWWPEVKVRLRTGRSISVHDQWTVQSEWMDALAGQLCLWSGCYSPGRFEGCSGGRNMYVMSFLFSFSICKNCN